VVSDRTFRSIPRSLGLLGLGLVVLSLGDLSGITTTLAPAPAHASRAEDDLVRRYEGLQVEIEELASDADRIDRSVAPGRGFITSDQAVQRYQDYVFLHLVGEYEQAAEGFYSLVTTVALDDAGLHWDAEWYLAESLYKMGNLRTAEANYRVIVEDPEHPFHDDAVRRLLELYVQLEDDAAFEKLYEDEIVAGRVEASDLITYAIGKAFFQKGDYVQAKSNLGDVSADSAWYRKARYILGSIMVLEGNLETAAQVFRSITELSVETQDDRRILDLSLLALGRIYMELGMYEEASSHYGRISSDSEYLADKLYEEVWTFIKQKEEIRLLRTENGEDLSAEELRLLEAREAELVQQSLRGIDIFLLAYPEHPYTPKLKLLQGHLHIQAVEYDNAMRSYENVISEYAPIRERFGELARSDDKPKEYFGQILRLGERFQGTRDQLPAYAMSMVMADRDLSRAITVYRDLESQRQTIAASEAIIGELQSVLSNAEGIGGFDQIRYDLQLDRSLGVQRHYDLIRLEAEVLVEALSGDAKREAEDVLAVVDDSKNRGLQGIAEGEVTMVRNDVEALRARLAPLRRQVSDPRLTDLLGKLDRQHDILWSADRKLADADRRLDPLESEELSRIRARFDREVGEVEKQRAELEQTLTEAQAVSEDLTRSGFGRLEDFFADSVLRADVGIVDVYWAQKVEVSDEKTRVIEERNALRDQISRRFELIEQKLRL